MLLIAFTLAFGLMALLDNWRWLGITGTMVAIGLAWIGLAAVRVLPPLGLDLGLAVILIPGLIGAAGGIVVSAIALGTKSATWPRVIVSVAGYLILASLFFVFG